MPEKFDNKIKKGKDFAPGTDNITYQLIRKLPEDLNNLMISIFQEIMKSR